MGQKKRESGGVTLISDIINQWGKESVIVSDLYLGSGTTMVAAHQLNRKCYGMEIDEKYCQVIIDRMLKLDPSLVIKKNGYLWENSVKTANAESGEHRTAQV